MRSKIAPPKKEYVKKSEIIAPKPSSNNAAAESEAPKLSSPATKQQHESPKLRSLRKQYFGIIAVHTENFHTPVSLTPNQTPQTIERIIKNMNRSM